MKKQEKLFSKPLWNRLCDALSLKVLLLYLKLTDKIMHERDTNLMQKKCKLTLLTYLLTRSRTQ